jgi:hypothetical protein
MDTHSPKLFMHKKNSSIGDKRIADKISKHLMKVHSQDLIRLLAEKTEQVKNLKREREKMLDQISGLKCELNSHTALPSLATRKDKKLEMVQSQLKESIQENQHLNKQLIELETLCSELLEFSNLQPDRAKSIKQRLYRSPRPLTLMSVKSVPKLHIESPVLSSFDEKYKSPRLTLRKSNQEKSHRALRSPYSSGKIVKTLKKSSSIDSKRFKLARSPSQGMSELDSHLDSIKRRTEDLLRSLSRQSSKANLS